MPAAEPTELTSTSLDHLGIVASIIDEIGLIEQVDKALGRHAQEAVSSGTAVKAMIINGLGFVSAPLYLFERFFIGKATEHLLGEGVKPEHLSDDKLGKVLDKLFDAGVSELFVKIALRACTTACTSPDCTSTPAPSACTELMKPRRAKKPRRG